MVQHRKLPIERSKRDRGVHESAYFNHIILSKMEVRSREKKFIPFSPIPVLPERDRPLIKVTRMLQRLHLTCIIIWLQIPTIGRNYSRE